MKEKDGRIFDDLNINTLSSEQNDTLMELGNIGSGNAITALSKLLDKKIEMALTILKVVPFWEVPYLYEAPETRVFGILSKIKDNSDLIFLQIYTVESVINIINTLMENHALNKEKIKVLEDLDDFSLSIISEIGNIVAGHYSSALANLMSIRLVPDVPDVALENVCALIDSIIASNCQTNDYSIIIENKLILDELEFKSHFFLIPSMETITHFIHALNLKYDF
jgi:chemotaxis protein CheC